MRRVPAALLLLLGLAAAFGLTLPRDASVMLVADGGTVVGVGRLAGGDLSLTLDAGAEGFVTLLIEGEDGSLLVLQGLVDPEGRVLVMGDGALEDLALWIEAAGGEVEVRLEERLARGAEGAPDEAGEAVGRAVDSVGQGPGGAGGGAEEGADRPSGGAGEAVVRGGEAAEEAAGEVAEGAADAARRVGDGIDGATDGGAGLDLELGAGDDREAGDGGDEREAGDGGDDRD